MRIVFMGTPQIAATCLQALLESGHEIVGVFTKPDTPKNRGMKLIPSEVKTLAAANGIPVAQPSSWKDPSVADILRSMRPDLVCVVAYGKILPQAVLDIPPCGCVNIHASLLPKLRGAGPIQWSILNGETETGVTAMYMSAGMDEGDIIAVERVPIADTDTGITLTEKLAQSGAELLVRTANRIAEGTVERTAQKHDEATYAPMLSKELCPIDWTRTFREISCQVRGLIPWPVAVTEIQGIRFKVYRVECAGDRSPDMQPGDVLGVDKKGLNIAAKDAVVRICELQAENGKRMAAADYFRGHPLTIGR